MTASGTKSSGYDALVLLRISNNVYSMFIANLQISVGNHV